MTKLDLKLDALPGYTVFRASVFELNTGLNIGFVCSALAPLIILICLVNKNISKQTEILIFAMGFIFGMFFMLKIILKKQIKCSTCSRAAAQLGLTKTSNGRVISERFYVCHFCKTATSNWFNFEDGAADA